MLLRRLDCVDSTKWIDEDKIAMDSDTPGIYKEKNPAPPPLIGVPTRINQVVDPSNIEAVNIRHIIVATEELARECKRIIVNQEKDFASLAATVSMCALTKAKGGDCGWIKNTNTAGQELDSMIISRDKEPMNPFDSDFLLPPEVINAALYMSKGDLVIKQSADSWHLIQLLDTETRLSPAVRKETSPAVSRQAGR